MPVERRDFLRIAGATAGGTLPGTATAQEGATVEMVTDGSSYYFDPIGLAVQPGETVTFENASGSHSATAYEAGRGPASTTRIPDGADGFDTGTLTAQGGTFEHTFETEGTYDYFCLPHKTLGMVGRIVVGEPGGPAEGSMPPDGDVPESSTIVEEGSVSYEAFTAGSGSSGGGSSDLLVGAGLFGGMAALAALVYRVGNSEGERYRVGSSEWRRKEGLE